MSERSDRVFKIMTESPQEADREIAAMGVVKHLPEHQQSAVRDLVGELIRAEKFNADPILDPENSKAFFLNSLIFLKRAIKAGVPQEVLLAILDKDFLEFKPVESRGHGSRIFAG